MKIRAVYLNDKDKAPRLYFYGDAAHQRATEACQNSESVYRVTIEIEGHNSSREVDGWAVGK